MSGAQGASVSALTDRSLEYWSADDDLTYWEEDFGSGSCGKSTEAYRDSYSIKIYEWGGIYQEIDDVDVEDITAGYFYYKGDTDVEEFDVLCRLEFTNRDDTYFWIIYNYNGAPSSWTYKSFLSGLLSVTDDGDIIEKIGFEFDVDSWQNNFCYFDFFKIP